MRTNAWLAMIVAGSLLAGGAGTALAEPPVEGQFPARIGGNDIDGNPISLDDYLGNVVLIDFWATWCGPCRRELPAVLDAYAKFHGRGFEILGVSLDSDLDRLRAFTTENGMTWRQYCDGRGWQSPMAARFGVDGIPQTILLDREGRVRRVGARGEDLVAAVEGLLAEIDPNDPAARPAWLGIVVDDSEEGGATVREVMEGGSAHGILQPGDRIVSFATTPISDRETLVATVRRSLAGATAEVRFVRGTEEQTVRLTLVAREDDTPPAPPAAPAATPGPAGQTPPPAAGGCPSCPGCTPAPAVPPDATGTPVPQQSPPAGTEPQPQTPPPSGG